MPTFLYLGPVQFSPHAASFHHSASPGEIWGPGCDSTGRINVGVRPFVLNRHMCLLPATLGRTGEPGSFTSLGLQSHDQMHAEDSTVQPSPISSYFMVGPLGTKSIKTMPFSSCHITCLNFNFSIMTSQSYYKDCREIMWRTRAPCLMSRLVVVHMVPASELHTSHFDRLALKTGPVTTSHLFPWWTTSCTPSFQAVTMGLSVVKVAKVSSNGA